MGFFGKLFGKSRSSDTRKVNDYTELYNPPPQPQNTTDTSLESYKEFIKQLDLSIIKNYQESLVQKLEIVNNTASPKEFFRTFFWIVECAEACEKMEHKGYFKHPYPSESLQIIWSNYQDTLHDLIDRIADRPPQHAAAALITLLSRDIPEKCRMHANEQLTIAMKKAVGTVDFVTIEQEPIAVNDIASPYNYSELYVREEGGGYYLLSPENTRIAITLLPLLNEIILKAIKICDVVPLRQFDDEQLLEPRCWSDPDWCYNLQLFFCPLTKVRREISTYPVAVHFEQDDELFATVQYNKEGKPAKIRIGIRGDICYTIHARLIADRLIINHIYENVMGQKTKLYPSPIPSAI